MQQPYCLCWLPDLEIDRITPNADLDLTLTLANQGHGPSLANLVRINLMVQHMRLHGMMKPVWCRNQHFQIIVGDSRIMAAKLIGMDQVPALAYLLQPQGTIVYSMDRLLHLIGFDGQGQILHQGSDDILSDPPKWVEISHPSTLNHGHDEQRRLQAMLDHLMQQPKILTREWVLEPKDWGDIFA